MRRLRPFPPLKGAKAAFRPDYLHGTKADGLAEAEWALDHPRGGPPAAHDGGGGDVVVELGPVVGPGVAIQHLRGRQCCGLHILGRGGSRSYTMGVGSS